jgi:DNA helicase IV
MPAADHTGGAEDEISGELARERDHLATSRDALTAMRADVLALEPMAGDPVSLEYLKLDLHRRAEALKDLPDTPLFFGRLDYGPESADHAGERLHIGRRHVHDGTGSPLVIDWRAPVSRPFYRASPADPLGVALRRRYGFAGSGLTGFEDENLAAGEVAGTGGRILVEEIERPRVGPMRDIVATIQPDQDDIVRADPDVTVCVQGAPGTGKTAVGLHRVAYLLYAYAERMRRGGVLVIGPNTAFLGYIAGVLPALGEIGVTQTTLAGLLPVPVRAADTPRAARLKGDARMAEVLRRALWARLNPAAEAVVLPRGSRRWRVPAYQLDDLVAELRDRGVRYGAGRDLLAHRIAHVILTRIEEAGEACDDRTHDAVRRTKIVRTAVDALWPKADPVRVVIETLSDPAALAVAADGVLTAEEQQAIVWATPARGPKSARWSVGDAVLVDEATDLIELTPGLAHVVIDEAQDLSPMQARAIGRRCATGSATVLGDIAQGTTAWAVDDWATLLTHLGRPAPIRSELTVGYRVPRQILDYAGLLLPHIAPALAPASSMRQSPGSLDIRSATAATLPEAVADACRAALTEEGSVGVITADADVAALARTLTAAGIEHAVLDDDAVLGAARLTVVPAGMAKGLEFDHVIVVEPADVVAAEPRGLHRLYVLLTRAVSRLTVLHTRPLPEPLA